MTLVPGRATCVRVAATLLVLAALGAALGGSLIVAGGPPRLALGGLVLPLPSPAMAVKLSVFLVLLAALVRWSSAGPRQPARTASELLDDPLAALGGPGWPGERGRWLLGALGFAGIAVYFVGFKVRQHLTYDTGAFDLALYDHALYHTHHGRFMQAFGVEGSYFGQHFAPVLLLLLPLYALWPDALLLLVVQGLVAALTVAVATALAARLGLAPWLGVLAGLVFTLHPAYWRGFRFDFHPEMLLPLCLFGALAALHADRPRLAYAACLLALTIKEDVSLYLALFGGLVMLTQRARWGALVVLTSVGWGLLAFLVAIPLAAGPQAPPLLGRYPHGHSWPAISLGLLADAPRLALAAVDTAGVRLLKPLLFAPLLAPGYLLIATVATMANVASVWGPQARLEAYYGVPTLTLVMLGYLTVLGRLVRSGSIGKGLAVALLLGVFALARLPPWRPVLPADRFASARIAELAAQRRSVSANAVVVPHLPKERPVHLFPVVHDADAIVVYLRPGDAPLLFDRPREFFDALRRQLDDDRYRVEAFDGHTLLLGRGPRDATRARAVAEALQARFADVDARSRR